MSNASPAIIDNDNGLPALVKRAADSLMSANTSAEVLEARDAAKVAYDAAKLAGRMARAKRAHDDVIGAVYRAQADALLIEARAKARLADEYDAAQERGEVAGSGYRSDLVGDDNEVRKPTASDLGLRRDEIHEARQVRDAEIASPGFLESAVEDRVSMGQEPTKAFVKERVAEANGRPVRGTTGTGENEWYTPQEHIERARRVLGGFDVDPASSDTAQEKVGAGQFFTAEMSGLEQEWGGRVWLNPPYAQPLISQFMEKLRDEVEAGRCTSAIALTHNYTDTKWFQATARVATAICFTRGRIRFYSPSGDIAAPTQGQAFFYFGDDVDTFRTEFSEVGFVVEVLHG